jgi:hypothetical protein
VRTHRPAVLRAGITALQSCDALRATASTIPPSVPASRTGCSVGRFRNGPSAALLLKGLEADTSVNLNASDLDVRNLYVAMTRGSKRLVVCSDKSILTRSFGVQASRLSVARVEVGRWLPLAIPLSNVCLVA